MKDIDHIWHFSRYEQEELENKIRVSDDFLRAIADLDKLEIWQSTIDLSRPSFDEQLQSLVLATAVKIQRRRRSFFGRVLFAILHFLSSLFPTRSSSKAVEFYELDSDRADFIDFLNEIRSIVGERLVSYIRIYKRISKARRGNRLIDIRRSTRRFKFLRIYSNNTDEEDLIANLNMKIYY